MSKKEIQLREIYYQPDHLWKGRTAIKELKNRTSGISRKFIKEWIAKQALWQVHLPRPKKIQYPHFFVTKVNKIHQADLLFLPHDKVYQNTYKYTLNVIDIASGYKVSRPLRTKQASEVADMFKDIYKKGPLKYPEELHVDNGTEFKSVVLKLMKEHKVEVKSVTTKYHHRFTSFVENFNKTLAERLFKIQDAQELQNPTKDSRVWVKYLYRIVNQINNSKLKRIGMTPAKAIKIENVTLKFNDFPAEPLGDEKQPLETDGLYRYLYESGELEGGRDRRATDMIWSWNTFRLDRIFEEKGQRILYYLAEPAPTRAFVREELMQIPEDTELPPDYVKEW